MLPRWDAHNAWLLADSKARSNLILKCGDLQIQLVHLLRTSQAVWATLRATYDHVDIATQITARRRLIMLQLHEGNHSQASLINGQHSWMRL